MRNPKLSIIILAAAILTSTALPVHAEPAHAGPVADVRFGIAEGFRNPAVMADIGAGWERLVLPWDQIQPDAAGDFSHLGQTLTNAQVQAELDRGTNVAGLLQFTPDWAAANPADGDALGPQEPRTSPSTTRTTTAASTSTRRPSTTPARSTSGSSGTSPSSSRPTPARAAASPGSAPTNSSPS